MIKKAKYIWLDGDFVPWNKATVHVLTHTLHYGNGVFEGVRGYRLKDGIAIFKLKEHTQRLINSAKIMKILPDISKDKINSIQIDLVRKNSFTSNIYIRPLVFLGYGQMGINYKGIKPKLMIAAWEWGAYLSKHGLEQGIRVKISSFTKQVPNSAMLKAKVVGNYINSQLAKYEAIEDGYDEALLLDDQGYLSEGTGECLFIIRDGILITPHNDNSLESITQNTVLSIAEDMKLKCVKRKITRDELYIADEIFLTGTAAEITPVKEVDGIKIGASTRGTITTKIQKCFFDIVYNRDKKYSNFLTYVKDSDAS